MAVESSAEWIRGGLKLEITCRLRDNVVPAAGPVVGAIQFTNKSSGLGYVLTSSFHDRPAYLKFAGELKQVHLSLRDPAGTTTSVPEGPIATIALSSGEVREVRVVVNQFLSLESTRAVLAPGSKAPLRLDWQWQMVSFDQALGDAGPPTDAGWVGGQLELTVVRDDDLLKKTIATLAERLEQDAEPIAKDPVGRREAILALTSLRVPEAIEPLRRLTSYPDLDVRMRAEQALRAGIQ